MYSIWTTLKLDFYVIKGSIKLLIGIAYLIALIIGIFAKTTYMMPVIILLISAVASGWFFSVYEKNHLSKLYGSLPIGRTNIVIARYLFALIFAFLNCILAFLITALFAFKINNNLTIVELFASLAIGFLYYCFVVSIVYPLYIRFNYSKVYVVTNLPLYLLFVFGMLVYRKLGNQAEALKSVKEFFQYFIDHPSMIWITSLSISAVLILISFFISKKLYKHAEL